MIVVKKRQHLGQLFSLNYQKSATLRSLGMGGTEIFQWKLLEECNYLTWDLGQQCKHPISTEVIEVLSI